ncbi:MAG: dTDP-4-dehydrorhamnose reductase [Candidatus Aenigmarchaeota archaeon]|nr:dTDP-4-dehydrorhamnose reductase [Candidatus Aenigmarchaeota archaeon]
MAKGRLFITGFGGQIGTDLALQAKEWDVLAAFHRTGQGLGVPTVRMDVTEHDRVRALLREFRPDVVMHAASLTQVDLCERERELARQVNVDATQVLAEACREVGAFLVYFSTDFVFDGERGGYAPTDQPSPVNYYGLTKLQGEAFCQGGLIARTSVVYSPHPHSFNFARWVVDELRAGKALRIVTDQVASPSLSSNIAAAALELAERRLPGILHLAGSEAISRHDFALRIAKEFRLDRSLITPILTEALQQLARRPKDSSLDVRQAQSLLKTKLLNVEEGLRALHQEMADV